MLFALAAFVSRDVLFKGQSLGKRFFGLHIYDRKTLQQTSLKQRFLRNVFFFLPFVDGIILLVIGETIGDRVAGTIVLSKKEFERYKEKQREEECSGGESSDVKKSDSRKRLKIVVIVIVCVIGFLGLIQIALTAQKDTEEYQAAYHYFVESDAFLELKVDASKIRMNRYSLESRFCESEDCIIGTVEIGFMVGFRKFEVICHKEDGVWKVCDACTLFD